VPREKTPEQWKIDFLLQASTTDVIVIEATPQGARAGRAMLYHTETDSYELEIFIVPMFWGAGLGMLAARELVEIAEQSLSARTVSATVHPDNVAALRLLQGLSFVRDCAAKPTGWQEGHHVYRRRHGA
jgi:RimJ/RimL family protein N-acetyltransferase